MLDSSAIKEWAEKRLTGLNERLKASCGNSNFANSAFLWERIQELDMLLCFIKGNSKDEDGSCIKTIFENNKLRVKKNPSGEIFIENKNNNTCLRIGDTPDGLRAIAHNGNLNPWSINGLQAFICVAEKVLGEM